CEKYDGTLKWKAPLKGKPAATLASVDKQVLAVSRDGFLEAIDTRNGAIAWRLALKKEVESQPLFVGNLMYFGAVDGDLVCLELSAAETKAKAGSA
ncbi:MAG: PQQ-binding-like beta-propeller repeat protein, partial [Candidatus Melainabacteria bacterium]|nr:PQQ-binding-like beta-propeller repeat protein [Candidatus Melainabacteria bacterium]